ncbi:MAG: ATP-binding protein [Lachnospiraceae bacterium]|nr:ATP-binding protein [Lachnospiraceae bacterium]
MYTGKYLNPNNFAFQRALNEDIYVDKTDLIKFCNDRVNKKKSYICSTRPRRFGKSMAIDMLKAYYSKGCDSKELFEGLSVSKYNMEKASEEKLSKKFTQYMNSFDVICFDMQWVMTKTKEDKVNNAVDWIQERITEELSKEFPDCIREDYDLSETLYEINNVTGRQFVILIDEWDALFRLDKNNKKAQEEYLIFLRSLFKGQAAENVVAFAYITGILPIKKYGGESALNNFEEFTMVSPANMVDYIGFTEDEVRDLCEEYDMCFDKMKKWYDGYTLKSKHIYSPNSVCTAITRNEIDNYWVSTDTYESLQIYISLNFEGLRDDIITMIAGGRSKADVGLFTNDLVSFRSKDEVMACLVHLGYLAYDSKTEEVFIPNKEVRTVFERAIKTASEWTEIMEAIRDSEQLMKYTLTKNADAVAKAVATVHANATSIKKYNDENSLSCAITLAYYTAMKDYKLIRELPSGVGYADIVFLPHPGVLDKPVLVVELKCDKTAKTALDQIKDRQYGEHLKDYTGKIILVGINYDKDDKNKIHTCIIEELEKEG